jgi:hypothetical protein
VYAVWVVLVAVAAACSQLADSHPVIVRSDTFLASSLAVLSPLYFLYLWFAKRTVRGMILAPFHFGVALIAGLAGFAMTGFFVGGVLNSQLDQHAAQRYVKPVVRSRDVGDGVYYVYINSWKGAGSMERIKCNVHDHRSAEALGRNAVAVVQVKPGLFGFEWVESLQVVSSEKAQDSDTADPKRQR